MSKDDDEIRKLREQHRKAMAKGKRDAQRRQAEARKLLRRKGGPKDGQK